MGKKGGREEICQFNIIKVNVPQKFLIRCFYKQGYLTTKEITRISQKLTQINQVENQLLHLKSIVEKCLLKSTNIR